MNSRAMVRSAGLGAVSGMRTMAGARALSSRHRTALRLAVTAMAVGEMIVDKSAIIGDRTQAGQLAGRAVMGGLVGGLAARERHGNVVAGAALGAVAAVAVAHLAFRLRQRLAGNSVIGGLVEDGIAIGAGRALAAV